MTTNVEIIASYLREHGPEPVARDVINNYCHVMTTGLTVGRGSSPGTPVGTAGVTSVSPGGARGGWRFTSGGPSEETFVQKPHHPIIGAVEVDRVFGGWVIGILLVWTNITPWTIFLVGGRRPDRNGRMIGSIQAPDGWLEQSENEARANEAGYVPRLVRL